MLKIQPGDNCKFRLVKFIANQGWDVANACVGKDHGRIYYMRLPTRALDHAPPSGTVDRFRGYKPSQNVRWIDCRESIWNPFSGESKLVSDKPPMPLLPPTPDSAAST